MLLVVRVGLENIYAFFVILFHVEYAAERFNPFKECAEKHYLVFYPLLIGSEVNPEVAEIYCNFGVSVITFKKPRLPPRASIGLLKQALPINAAVTPSIAARRAL